MDEYMDGLRGQIDSALKVLATLTPGSKEYADVLADLRTLCELQNTELRRTLDEEKLAFDKLKEEHSFGLDVVKQEHQKHIDETKLTHEWMRDRAAEDFKTKELVLEQDKEETRKEELKFEKLKLGVVTGKDVAQTAAVGILGVLAIAADENGWMVSKQGLSLLPKFKIF